MALLMQQSQADRLVEAAAHALTKGDRARAADLLDRAVGLEPRNPMALTKLAEIAVLAKDPLKALGLTGAALDVEPYFAPAWMQRAVALWLSGHPDDAAAAARRAMDIQPPNPDYRLRFAQFAAWTGRGHEVQDALAPLLPDNHHDLVHHAAAVSLLGELAIAEGRFRDAEPWLDKALALAPGQAVTRMLRGMNQLRLGHYAAGWADFAAREAIPVLAVNRPVPEGCEPWIGQDLNGRTILVQDDQGHGDAIQFFRYAALLHARGAKVIWATFAPLVRLFAASAPYATVVNDLSDAAQAEFFCNSTSLPRLFATQVNTIPSGKGYLRPAATLLSPIKLPSGRRLKVGLSWSGDERYTRDHLRSMPAATFLTLGDVRGISFHSLQFKVRAADQAALADRPSIGRGIELAAADFADTAAFVAKLDLVITIDSGIAHLAAALGKPVWLIVHVAPDWRWMADREDSPWYPTVTLFRVTPDEWRSGANWRPVIARVAAALRDFAAR